MRLATPVGATILISMIFNAFGQTTIGPHGNQDPRNLTAMDYEQFVSYWTTEPGWHSELQLRNNQPDHDLAVLPILRTADGGEAKLPAVIVKPAQVKSIDIGESAPQLAGRYGSVVLRYHSTASRALYAALMIHDMGHPIAFHLDGVAEAKDFDSMGVSREGIWWLPNESVADFLVLTNQSATSIKFDMALYDASGKQSRHTLIIGPRQTTRYSVRQLVRSSGLGGSYGGIKILAHAHEGSLDSVHFIFDEQAGFSALLKMFDHDPHATIAERDHAGTGNWTLRAPMLALSEPDPALQFPIDINLEAKIFIRNTTNRPTSADLRFNWRGQSTTGKAFGPPVSLAPFETRLIDVSALQDGKTLPRDAHWASVVLISKGLPDEMMAVAASYDKTLRYGAQTPFSDQLSFAWEGGRWEYNAQQDSIITGGNGGTKPIPVAFTVFYNEGAEKYEMEQTLQPDEQMWIDIGKLIRERIPDKNGKTFPVDLVSGSYEFRDLADKGVGHVFEGKVIYDKTFGHVTYGCGGPCCDNAPYLTNNPLGIPFQGVSDNGVMSSSNCGGNPFPVDGDFYGGWNTANHGIATVDYYGKHTGVAAGSTTSNTLGQIDQVYGRYSCTLQSRNPSGGDNVQTPTSLSIVSGTDSTTAEATCSAGTGCGCTRSFTYQVNDQTGSPMKVAGLELWDAISTTTPNYLNLTGYTTTCSPPNTGPCGVTTNVDGQFKELSLNACAPACKSGNACIKAGPTNADQTWHVGSAQIVQHIGYYCDHVTVNGK